jgi:hypothetical protein
MAINRFPLVRGMLLRHSDTSGVAFCRRHVYSSRAGPVALSSQALPAFNWCRKWITWASAIPSPDRG